MLLTIHKHANVFKSRLPDALLNVIQDKLQAKNEKSGLVGVRSRAWPDLNPNLKILIMETEDDQESGCANKFYCLPFLLIF